MRKYILKVLLIGLSINFPAFSFALGCDGFDYINFGNYTLFMGITLGSFFVLFSLVLHNFVAKSLDSRIQSMYENELIISTLEMPLWVKLFPMFCSGIFLGGYVLPFFVFENVKQIKMFTADNLIFFIIYCIWAILVFFSVTTHRIYLTNKRILSTQILRCFIRLKLYNFLLEDINVVNYKNKSIIISLINGEVFDTGVKPRSEEFYKELVYILNNERKI